MGGPQHRSLAVANELRESDIETLFIIPHGEGEFADVASNDGFDVYRRTLPRIRKPTRIRANIRFLSCFRRAVRTIRKVIDATDTDVVHANMPLNFQPAYATARSDAKLVWHFNDTVAPYPLNRIAAKLARRWADEIVITSDVVQQYFFDPEVETTTLYPPVDTTKFDTEAVSTDDPFEAELSVTSDTTVIGTVGNVNPVKGYEYLLRAIADLPADLHPFVVPIVGSELDSQKSYSQKLRRLRSELGLEGVVSFVGWKSDIPAVMSALDLFVLPSIRESGPMVVLEAMMMDCPVVTTNVGIVPENFDDERHCWIVEPGDADALARAIDDALSAHERRHTCIENARQKLSAEFSLPAVAAAHERLYCAVLDRS